jgi:hypothetical protein
MNPAPAQSLPPRQDFDSASLQEAHGGLVEDLPASTVCVANDPLPADALMVPDLRGTATPSMTVTTGAQLVVYSRRRATTTRAISTATTAPQDAQSTSSASLFISRMSKVVEGGGIRLR